MNYIIPHFHFLGLKVKVAVDRESGLSLTRWDVRRSRVVMTLFSSLSRALWLSCPPPKREFLFVTSYRHLFWQFFSESPSSSSPMMSTAENINATRMAKQQTRAKITMHFCWDCRRERRWPSQRSRSRLGSPRCHSFSKCDENALGSNHFHHCQRRVLSGWKMPKTFMLVPDTAFNTPHPHLNC